jgi:glycosyltransferase involved in cell wall biosynthesis
MFAASDVSVVIPCYNSRRTIATCLESLMNQECAPLEMIVADSSSDDTCEIIRQRFPQVRLYQFEGRTFPGPARNRGASLARGSIIAFTDSDCVVAPDWVRRMAEAHAEGHLVVGGAIEVGNRDNLVAWAGHLGEFREFLPVGSPRYVMHVPTCNISYRKKLFDNSDGFPNAYYPQEDLLFNYLLNRQGIRVWFDPAIHIQHFSREDLRGYLSHQHRIGRVTRCTLSRIELEGSAIARHATLAWLTSSGLGALKFVRTAGLFLAHYPRQALQRPALLPLLLLGSIWWTRGFAAGARTGLAGIRGWNDPNEPIFAKIISVNVSSQVEET